MKKLPYRQFGGVKTQFNPLDAPQNSFLLCDNYLLNRQFGALVKRGGSARWTKVGDGRGLGGYVRKLDQNLGTPILEYPIEHRKNISTSVFEYLDWETDTWTTIPQGTSVAGNVSSGAISAFAQQDELLCICAGIPMELTSITGTLNRLGGPGPTAKPTVATNGAGVLTSSGAGYRWHYTFYDSVTGWESSPSPTSDFLPLTAEQAQLSALETTVDKEGVDKKRIYRTVETGEDPFLFAAEIPLADLTYDDNNADTVLGVEAPISGDHNPPPQPSYVCAAFENRIWVASGSQLYYSKNYNGNAVNLSYFSELRKFDFQQRVTGLTRYQQKLMTFFPPKFGITEIRRLSDGSFTDIEFNQEEGTNYHHSISTHDQYMAFWGATGPKLFDAAGPVDRFDEDIQNFLHPMLVNEYQKDVYVWSVYHDETDQFLFGFSANDNEACWFEEGTLNPIEAFDCVTGDALCWEEATFPPALEGPGTYAPLDDIIFTYYINYFSSATTTPPWRMYENGNSTPVATGTVERDFDKANNLPPPSDHGTAKVDTPATPPGAGKYLMMVASDIFSGSNVAIYRPFEITIADNSALVCKEAYRRATPGDTLYFAYHSLSHPASPTANVYHEASTTATASIAMTELDSNLRPTLGNRSTYIVAIDTTAYSDGLYHVFANETTTEGAASFQFVVETCTATELGQACQSWSNVFAVDSTARIPWNYGQDIWGGIFNHRGTESWRLYPAGSQTASLSGSFSAWDAGTYDEQQMAVMDLTGLAAGQYHFFQSHESLLGGDFDDTWVASEIWINDCVTTATDKLAPYTFRPNTTIYLTNPAFADEGRGENAAVYRLYKAGQTTAFQTGTATLWDSPTLADMYVAQIDTTDFPNGLYHITFEYGPPGSVSTSHHVMFRIEALPS